MSLLTIGQAIATRLETISGLQVFSPDEIPDSINSFPCAIIMPPKTVYHPSQDGGIFSDWRILVIVSRQDMPSALTTLIPFMEETGTYSIKAAIEADRQLGATALDCIVTDNSGAGVVIWGGQSYLGTEFEMQTKA